MNLETTVDKLLRKIGEQSVLIDHLTEQCSYAATEMTRLNEQNARLKDQLEELINGRLVKADDSERVF